MIRQNCRILSDNVCDFYALGMFRADLFTYAVIGSKRFAGLPQLKTMGQLGYKTK